VTREVAYNRQTIDTANPVARYAHRQRHKLSLDRAAAEVRQGGTVLDYGCGDGAFLNALAEARPDLTLLGFDPESGHEPEGYRAVAAIDDVPDGSLDLLCCFETLEHLYPDETARFAADADRMLAPGGQVLISVPIIGGPPLLAKELNRMAMFRRRSDYSTRELLAASLAGRPAARPDDIRVTHKGFDHRRVLAGLGGDFTAADAACCPFPGLPWWLNSQWFALLRRSPSPPSGPASA
jgi:2-polyprenyl-3-methyl-5-hydroxy-6-metoxy-1,4-benzoquinol methylase